ncbi:MAG: hypothetical protein ACRDDY_00310, partial [Clostridium sp.]
MTSLKVDEFNIEIKEAKALYRANIAVGGDDRNNYLYSKLKNSFKKAKRIDIIVSFLMESGVKLIMEDLR